MRPERFGPGPARARRTGGGCLILALLLLAWAGGATWLAVSGRLVLEEQTRAHEAARAADEEKLRILTRRFVGATSYGALEREGLSGSMADVMTRQAELEEHQEALAALVARLTASFIPPQGARPQGPAPLPTVGVQGPAAVPPKSEGAPPRSGRRPRASLDGEAVPPREQLAQIEVSIARVAGGHRQAVQTLAAGVDGGLKRFRDALGQLGPEVRAALVADDDPRPGTDAASVLSEPALLARLEVRAGELARLSATAAILPVRRPVPGTVLTSNFGQRKDPFTGATAMHSGIDFRAPAGTPVYAASAGTVVVARASNGYGNLVELDHGAGFTTRYAHLSEIGVREGQPVSAGDVIGEIGSTGRSTGPHLHYETRVGGNPIDPTRLLEVGTELYGLPANVVVADKADVVDDAHID